MRNKALALLLSVVVGISVTACGGSDPATPNQEVSENNQTEYVKIPEESKTETADVYFKDDVLKIEMATIKITGFEVAPPNTDWGEEKSTLIITYDFTNDSDELMQPGDAWIACFTATQETETTVDDLDVAISPQDEKYSEMNDMFFTDVKPGATVSSVISYEINDLNTPIVLKATQGMFGEDLGEKIFNLK